MIGNRPQVRADGRVPTQLRPVRFELGVQKWAEGSCIVHFGDTRVLCAATIADRVPPHLRGKGTGWVTAEYSMLPRATAERTDRESVKGKLGGRAQEIQWLIGRSASAGISQPRASSWQHCSAVKRPGLPERGKSTNRAATSGGA